MNKIHTTIVPILFIETSTGIGYLCASTETAEMIISKGDPLFDKLDNIYEETDINLKPLSIDVIIEKGKGIVENLSSKKEDILSTEELEGKYKLLLKSNSKLRKRLYNTLEIKTNGKTIQYFDVVIVNTHHKYNTLIEAIVIYNSIQ